LFWRSGFAPGLFQKKTEPAWGPPHPCSDTNQLESNHYMLCQPTQINATLYQTTFYEFIPFSSSIHSHTLRKVGVSTCKIKAFQCFLTKRVSVMIGHSLCWSQYTFHSYQRLPKSGVRQTNTRGKKTKAGSKKLNSEKRISRLPKHHSVISGVSPAPFPVPLDNPVT